MDGQDAIGAEGARRDWRIWFGLGSTLFWLCVGGPNDSSQQ